MFKVYKEKGYSRSPARTAISRKKTSRSAGRTTTWLKHLSKVILDHILYTNTVCRRKNNRRSTSRTAIC